MRELPQSRLRERRRKRRALVLLLSLAGILTLCGGAVALARAPFMRIRTIDVSGAQAVSSTTLRQFASEELSGDFWLVIPKDNILFYPKHKIEADTLAAFPELKSADARAATFTDMQLRVSERTPAALWCGAVPDSREDCFLLDADGVAYAPAGQFSQSPYTVYFGALASSKPPGQFLNSEAFKALSALTAALGKAAGADIDNVSVDGNDDVRLKFTTGFTLIFALRDDSGTILDHFTAAESAGPFAEHPLSDFDYLDLRFGQKLYYKLK